MLSTKVEDMVGVKSINANGINPRKAGFPLFTDRAAADGIVYLDNAATTQKAGVVFEALDDYNRRHNANVHRGIHTLSAEATELYEGARKKVARFIGADSDTEIVFVRNTTEAINIAGRSFVKRFLKEGDQIILSEMEHHSNLVPWQILAKEYGLTLKFIPVTDDGRLDYLEFERLLTNKTRLVSVVHVSNVLGTVNDVERIIGRAHEAGAKVLLDTAQSVPHSPLNVRTLDADFVAFSGHKMYGPMGIGVLYGKASLLNEMGPVFGGGEMIRSVSLTESSWNELPHKFEAGTPNVEGAVGLAAAVDYIESVGFAEIEKTESALVHQLWDSLNALGHIDLYGPDPRDGDHSGAVSFNVQGIHPHDLAHFLDTKGVAVRAGHHCAQPLMRRFGLAATARASFGLYNDASDIDRFLSALTEAKKFFHI